MVETVTWEQVGLKGFTFVSPACKSNGHVFLSGSVGIDANGKIPVDLAEQTELAIANFKTTLTKSGSSINRVLKVLLFIAHPSYAPVVNEIYSKHFTGQPARSCIVVGFPDPALKVELEGVAEYGGPQAKL